MRNNPLQGVFDGPWPRIDARPGRSPWTFSSPAAHADGDYASDCEIFGALGPARHAFIRSALPAPEMPGSWDATGILALEVTTLVCRAVPGWHFELPFWRGPLPYQLVATTDAEVMAIVTECVALGGYDSKALANWRAAVVAKMAWQAR
jgi:hypothetical protein